MGINYELRKQDYKSAKELYNLYKEVIEKGGNFCINLGPDDGNFDDPEEKIIKKLGRLIKENK